MIEAGNCPSTGLDANWVITRSRANADASDPDQDYFGTFSYNAQDSSARLGARYALTDGFPGMTASDVGDSSNTSCTDGALQLADAQMYLSSGGTALVHTNTTEPDEAAIIFAMPQVSVNSIEALDGNYAGLVFNQAAADARLLRPATLTCIAGICNGTLYATFAAALDGSSSGTSGSGENAFELNLFGTLDQPQPGFVTGRVRANGNEGNVACAVTTSTSNDRLVSCIGQAPGGNEQMFNLLLTQQAG